MRWVYIIANESANVKRKDDINSKKLRIKPHLSQEQKRSFTSHYTIYVLRIFNEPPVD